MKQQLTKEQSRKLFDMGIPITAATGSVVEENSGDNNAWHYPTFTIGDLMDLLPLSAYVDDKYLAFDINIRKTPRFCRWEIEFSCNRFFKKTISDTHLIDALFNLVVWCVDNKYIETNQLSE